MARTQTKKPLKIDSALVKLQVNHKTWIYVKPDLPEKEIERIVNKFKNISSIKYT